MLDLSPQDKEYCRDVTTQLLDRTLYECEELGLDTAPNASMARLDSRQWKRLQTHPNTTLYADRNPKAAWSPTMHREDWGHPIAVVAVGEFQCSVDDMLLALVTPDVATQRQRTVLMGQRAMTQCHHQTIVKPTQAKPFHLLTVCRYVVTQHWPHTMFVGPREMLLAFATGDVISSSGKRFGYEITQSVSLKQTYPRSASLPRTQMIKACIFWEQPDGSVGIYKKLVVDAKSHLPDTVKLGTLCRETRCLWKFVPRSIEIKKLRWCMKNRKVVVRELQRQTLMRGCAGCGIITQKSQSVNMRGLNSMSSHNLCEFCEAWLCGMSYCRVNCQIKMVNCSETNMYEMTVMVCPRCISFVRSIPAIDMTRSELLEAQRTAHTGAIILANLE
ncbi:unnamed protein product [Phytophthora fragariaefolia]|uniref:Unnamed protein product n=1 Tax=Phytophthora fragariaefolia TaxID=1490495 RepID=A0A9W6U727_9STRA|nr:unnamed protein product [Phytophthora fragariaefolia]